MMRAKTLWLGATALLAGAAMALPAQAGDSNGNFQVKVGVTGVLLDDDTKSVTLGGAAVPNASAETNDNVIPTLTLAYFFDKHWAVELFCCFDQVNVTGKGSLAQYGKLASTWAFPPILTLQYHFDGFGAFKPYVGAGVEWIHYFDSKSNIGGGADFDDSFGFALQVGTDIDLGQGWSIGLDVKKVWEDTEITWVNNNLGQTVVAKHDLDPWFVTANLGYRFNLEDIFGARTAAAPLK